MIRGATPDATIGHPAAVRAGAHPYHRIGIVCQIVKPTGIFAATLSQFSLRPGLPIAERIGKC
jgi:hypothetical protein